jgi:hypothetical protein
MLPNNPKDRIDRLPDVIMMTDANNDRFEFNLNSKSNIFAWTYLRRRNISFREYLTDMIRANPQKALDIIDILERHETAPFAEQQRLIAVLYQKLSVQRYAIHPKKTAGQAIFDQACKKIDYVPVPPKKKKNPVPQFKPTHTINASFDPDQELDTSRWFDDIPPNYYRRGIYTSHDLSGTIKLFAPDDICVENLPIADKAKHGNMEVREIPRHGIRGEANTWLPLTTLTMDDLIRPHGFHADFPYKLGYSKKANQYYMMPLEPAKDNIYYVSYKLRTTKKNEIPYLPDIAFDADEQACLEALTSFQFGDVAKEKNLKALFETLPTERKLMVIQHHLHQFKSENISHYFKSLTLPALNLFLKERKGICAQLALIGHLLASMLGMTSRYVRNGLHAFCEIENYSICMGGRRTNELQQRLKIDVTRFTDRLSFGSLHAFYQPPNYQHNVILAKLSDEKIEGMKLEIQRSNLTLDFTRLNDPTRDTTRLYDLTRKSRQNGQ